MSDILADAPHSVDDYLKAYEGEGKLRGFRCAGCGLITATWGIACSRCGRSPLDDTELSQKGSVIAFTLLTVPGEEFLNDAPYAYVVVELDGGGRITGWMPSVRTEKDIAIGDRVHFVTGYKPGVQFAKDSAAAGSS